MNFLFGCNIAAYKISIDMQAQSKNIKENKNERGSKKLSIGAQNDCGVEKKWP